MAAVNKKRVALGVLVGGLVWSVWSAVVNAVILSPHYITAYEKGELIKGGRYPLFLLYWFVGIFLFTYILMWIYLSLRVTLGPGPKTALRVGFLVGFAIAFPVNLTVAPGFRSAASSRCGGCSISGSVRCSRPLFRRGSIRMRDGAPPLERHAGLKPGATMPRRTAACSPCGRCGRGGRGRARRD